MFIASGFYVLCNNNGIVLFCRFCCFKYICFGCYLREPRIDSRTQTHSYKYADTHILTHTQTYMQIHGHTHIHEYTHIHIYESIFTYTCIYSHWHTHTFAHILAIIRVTNLWQKVVSVRLNVCLCPCVYVYVPLYVFVFVFVCVCAPVCVRVFVCICFYPSVCMHSLNTYTQAHIINIHAFAHPESRSSQPLSHNQSRTKSTTKHV